MTLVVKNVNSDYSIPAELSQCTFTRMTSSSGRNMTVVRCPSSTVTATEHNKAMTTTVTIDGNEYVSEALMISGMHNSVKLLNIPKLISEMVDSINVPDIIDAK